MTGDTDTPHGSATPAASALDAAVTAIASGADAPAGVCLAVSRGGRVWWCAHGVAQAFDDAGPLADPPPMDLDTRTDVGSVTKVMATTTALMVLVDAGELALERPLAELLPWTAGTSCGAATLAQLLEHRAGLWEWWPLYLSASDPEAALRVAAGLPLRYAPGDARHYSDLGFQLLGAAVAAVAGRDLDDAVDALALAPLGLRRTAYRRPVAGAPVAASSHGDRIERRMIESGEPYPVTGDAASFDGWRTHTLVGEVNDGNAFHAFGSVAGHAGLFSTAADLLRFGEAMLAARTGGGFVTPGVLARFLRPGADSGQGLGWRRWKIDGAGDAWGHTGFPGVAVAVLPALDATVALITNRLHVRGASRPTEPMWQLALRAAAGHLTAADRAAI